MGARLEHVNITVSAPDRAADILCALFDWRIRWSGPARDGGRSVHVGVDDAYLALYTPPAAAGAAPASADFRGGLNHIGVVVADLDAAEQRVRDAGFRTFNHGAYEPGRRFYFLDGDDIEFEVVSYP